MTGTQWVLVAWFTVCGIGFIRTAELAWKTIADLRRVRAAGFGAEVRILANGKVIEALLRMAVFALWFVTGGSVIVGAHSLLYNMRPLLFDGSLLLAAILTWWKSEVELDERRRLSRMSNRTGDDS